MENDELKKYVKTSICALELACKVLNNANVEIKDADEMGEFLNAKAHGNLMGYFLDKAEEQQSEQKK